MVIDQYDPYIGTNFFSVGVLGVLPNDNLIHTSAVGITEDFYVAVGGGATEVAIIDGEKSYPLTYIPQIGLWKATVTYSEEGYKSLTLTAKDGAGNEKQKKIDSVFVYPAGNVIDEQTQEKIANYTLEVYTKTAEGDWVLWDASPFNQKNPMNVSDAGGSFVLPQGTYYMVVNSDDYRDSTSEPFTIEETQVVMPNVSLESIPEFFNKPILGFLYEKLDWGNKWEVSLIADMLDKSEDGFLGVGDVFPTTELFGAETVQTDYKLYSVFPTWNPFGQVQLDIFENIEDATLKDNIVVFSTIEPSGLLSSFLARGLQNVEIKYDKIGVSADYIDVSSAPYHYLVGPDGVIIERKTGVIPESEIESLFSSINN